MLIVKRRGKRAGLSHLPTALSCQNLQQKIVVPSGLKPATLYIDGAFDLLEKIHREVAPHSEVLRSVSHAYATVILAKGNIENPVQFVLDAGRP